MTQNLHVVFGGELKDPQSTEFENTDKIHVVGVFTDYDDAYNAWKAEAQRTVDNAHMRYFLAKLPPLDPTIGDPASPDASKG